jgi:Tol biopolymer transport system component
MSERQLRRLLSSVPVPGEEEARDRAWRVVRAAFAEREHVTWPRRHTRPLVAVAAAAVVVAAALSPPGRAVLNSIRDAVGREQVKQAKPALTSLPAMGRLLVSSGEGTWTVYYNGSRRNLGPYSEADWSPHGIFIVGTRGNQLVTVEPAAPKPSVHWVISRPQQLGHPRWAPDGYRIAYLAGPQLRVAVGDGSGDKFVATAAPVAPAWRPLPIREPVGSRHVLTYVDPAGRVVAIDTDSRTRLWRIDTGPDRVRALAWSDDGRRLLVLGQTSVQIRGPNGRLVAEFLTKGPSLAAAFAPRSHRLAFSVGALVLVGNSDTLPQGVHPVFSRLAGAITDLAWSPDGRWLLAAWPTADEWLFIRSTRVPSRTARVRDLEVVSDIGRQFNPGGSGPAPFPTIDGWCCAP